MNVLQKMVSRIQNSALPLQHHVETFSLVIGFITTIWTCCYFHMNFTSNSLFAADDLAKSIFTYFFDYFHKPFVIYRLHFSPFSIELQQRLYSSIWKSENSKMACPSLSSLQDMPLSQITL